MHCVCAGRQQSSKQHWTDGYAFCTDKPELLLVWDCWKQTVQNQCLWLCVKPGGEKKKTFVCVCVCVCVQTYVSRHWNCSKAVVFVKKMPWRVGGQMPAVCASLHRRRTVKWDTLNFSQQTTSTDRSKISARIWNRFTQVLGSMWWTLLDRTPVSNRRNRNSLFAVKIAKSTGHTNDCCTVAAALLICWESWGIVRSNSSTDKHLPIFRNKNGKPKTAAAILLLCVGQMYVYVSSIYRRIRVTWLCGLDWKTFVCVNFFVWNFFLTCQL